ncbi:MAG TPA: tetratricopeptide repeat protein [Bryobacteraceae bacterium]
MRWAFPKSLVMLLLVLTLAAQGPRALLAEADGYARRREFAKAAELYRQALASDPALVAARRNLGTVLWFLNRKAESEREFAAVLKQSPKDPVPHLYTGLAAYERQQFAAAKAHFQKAGPLALENPEVLPAVLEAYLATRDLSVPRRLLDQLQAATNPDPALVSRAGALFIQYGYTEMGIAALGKLTSSGHANVDTWLVLAGAHDKQGQPEKAYAAYGHALEADPDSEQAYLALAQFAMAHKNNQFALKVVQDGLRQAPGSARLLLEQGLLWATEGDRAKAAEAFWKAAQANPHSALPLLASGVLLLEDGDPHEAASRFREAAKADPRDYRAEYLYATALGRFDRQDAAVTAEAIAALRRAIALNPADANSRAALGKAYLAAKRVPEGIRELERALKLDPKNLTALYQLGLAYRSQGRTEEARRLLEQFKALKAKAGEEEAAAVQIMRIVSGK